MECHRINLKGPWETRGELAERAELMDAKIRDQRVRLPADWKSVFGLIPGTIEFRRRFHTPTNLSPRDQVFVCTDHCGGTGIVRLNGQLLGEFPPDDSTGWRFEVTELLQSFNELSIELTCQPGHEQNDGLCSPVAIEIVESP